jgi:molecular chaperone IbpA
MSKSLRAIDIPTINKFGVGFDSFLEDLFRANEDHLMGGKFPPHNIVKFSEENFAIEIAAAGFSIDDLSVELDGNMLRVKANKTENTQETNREYLHKGISTRNFIREFKIADHVNVTSAQMKDGILVIQLTRVLPEKKTKLISISAT